MRLNEAVLGKSEVSEAIREDSDESSQHQVAACLASGVVLCDWVKAHRLLLQTVVSSLLTSSDLICRKVTQGYSYYMTHPSDHPPLRQDTRQAHSSPPN